MSVARVIAVMNQMESDRIVERYAIGGAVGATFYLEPVSTVDIDIFVGFKQPSGEIFVSLRPIFEYLTSHGGVTEGEYIVIAGWPIQFLPPTSPLVEEALADAVTVDVDGTPARVFTAEHLAAIALQTGRAKDKARLLQFVEAGALDAKRFESILKRHHLVEKWKKFENIFLKGGI